MPFEFDPSTCFGYNRRKLSDAELAHLLEEKEQESEADKQRKAFGISADTLGQWGKKVKTTEQLAETISPKALFDTGDEENELNDIIKEAEGEMAAEAKARAKKDSDAITKGAASAAEETAEEETGKASAAGAAAIAAAAGATKKKGKTKAEKPELPVDPALKRPGPLVCVSSVKKFGVNHTDEVAERSMTDEKFSFWSKARLQKLEADPAFKSSSLDSWFEMGCPFAGVKLSQKSLFAQHAAKQQGAPLLCEPKTFGSAAAVPCDACYGWQEHAIDWAACEPEKAGDPPKCALVPKEEILMGSRQVLGVSTFGEKSPSPKDDGQANLGGAQFVAGVKNYFVDASMSKLSQKTPINIILHHRMPVPGLAEPVNEQDAADKEVKEENLNWLQPRVSLSLPKYQWLQDYAINAKVYDDALRKEAPNLAKMQIAQDYKDMCQSLENSDMQRWLNRVQQMWAECEDMQKTFVDLVEGPDKTEGTRIPIMQEVQTAGAEDDLGITTGGAPPPKKGGMTKWVDATAIGKTCGGLTKVDFENAKVNWLNLCKRTE